MAAERLKFSCKRPPERSEEVRLSAEFQPFGGCFVQLALASLPRFCEGPKLIWQCVTPLTAENPSFTKVSSLC